MKTSSEEPAPRGTLGMPRRLAAILSADVVGYSRLMGEDEEATVRTVTAYRDVIATLVQQHRGRVVDAPGDNVLAEFASVLDAVQGAVAIQRELNARNTALPPLRRMQFRLGLNLGDVIPDGERIYGDGVNIAARLESLAGAGVSGPGRVGACGPPGTPAALVGGRALGKDGPRGGGAVPPPWGRGRRL